MMKQIKNRTNAYRTVSLPELKTASGRVARTGRMKSESKTPHLLYPLLAHFIRLVRAARRHSGQWSVVSGQSEQQTNETQKAASDEWQLTLAAFLLTGH
jgi:hypothetical protein